MRLPSFRGPRLPAGFVAVGDACAFALFVLLGLRSHDEGVTLEGFARSFVPLAGGWFLAAMAFRTYRRPGPITFLRTWLIGVSAGVLVRSVWLGHPTGVDLLTFWLVTLAVTLVLLLMWRWAAGRLGRGRRRRWSARPAA
jgi:hypothetical protein